MIFVYAIIDKSMFKLDLADIYVCIYMYLYVYICLYIYNLK